MITIYEKFLKLNIDGSTIGLEPGNGESNYFCTPEGATVIGWAGADGIHYCFLPHFGEMVFGVSPMNTPGNYVHPVAKDFADFLRLLLVCGDVAALERVSLWNQAQFDAFMKDNPPTARQRTALKAIGEGLLLPPMEQPFTYIKALQAGFDYSGIKYTEEYYELVPLEPKMPEWKVYFDGNFWDYHGRDDACEEIPLNKQFVWDDETWHIPAVYTCSKGLVVVFCVQVLPERIRAYMDKWNFFNEDSGIDLINEPWMWPEAENPLAINMNPKAVLNETALLASHGSGVTWNPCIPVGDGIEAASAIKHYGLDPNYG